MKDLDGEIFVDGNLPPPPRSDSERDAYVANGGEQEYYFPPLDWRAETTLFERKLLQYVDPTSPPHVKKDCVRWIIVGGIKTCRGWRVQYRYLYRSAVLRVTTNTPTNVGEMIEDCLREAAVIAAIAAIVSGGSAAIGAAEAQLKLCLGRKLGQNLISLSITMHTWRGEWE